MTNKVKEKLVKARGYVARGLCQGYYARDLAGEFALPSQEEAVCWCSLGAIIKVTEDLELRAKMGNALTKVSGMANIAPYHDSLPSLEAVLAWWDKAIETL